VIADEILEYAFPSSSSTNVMGTYSAAMTFQFEGINVSGNPIAMASRSEWMLEVLKGRPEPWIAVPLRITEAQVRPFMMLWSWLNGNDTITGSMYLHQEAITTWMSYFGVPFDSSFMQVFLLTTLRGSRSSIIPLIQKIPRSAILRMRIANNLISTGRAITMVFGGASDEYQPWMHVSELDRVIRQAITIRSFTVPFLEAKNITRGVDVNAGDYMSVWNYIKPGAFGDFGEHRIYLITDIRGPLQYDSYNITVNFVGGESPAWVFTSMGEADVRVTGLVTFMRR
jgi:hypothetical protein